MSAASKPRSHGSTGATPAAAQPSVLGPYEILTRIAAGGMSVVYLARRRGPAGFKRLVAVKICRPELRDDPDFVRMFLTEARLAAAIHHPNVVPILEVEQGDELYLVMEYVEGASLQALLGGSRFPVSVAVRVVVDALRGLHAAHELRDDGDRLLDVVHRDVSPHNVLVGVDGAARITDFGVARAIAHGATTATGVLKGKIGYMAPEQLRAEPADRRADVFAAGVVLWEALTGQRLFRGQTPTETMSLVLSGPVHPPSMLADDVPRELDEVVLRALARDTGTRFPTTAAFADALERSGVGLASPDQVRERVLSVAGPEIERLRQAARAPVRDDAGAVAEHADHAEHAEPEPVEPTAWSSVRRRPSRAFLVRVALLALLGIVAGGAAAYAVWAAGDAPVAGGEGGADPDPDSDPDSDSDPDPGPDPDPDPDPETEVEAETEADTTGGAVGRRRGTPSSMRRRRSPARMGEAEPAGEYMPSGI